MIKKYGRLCVFMLLMVFMSFSLMGCGQTDKPSSGGDSSTEVINLKIADTYPPTAVNYKIMTEIFIPKLEESGKIKVTYYPGGEIGKAEDMLGLIQGGTTDIGYVSPGFVAGALPLSSVFSLPMEFNSDNVFSSKVVWRLVNEEPLKSEFQKQGVKPIYLSMNPPGEIFMAEIPVALPKDIKGKIIRGGGGDANEVLKLFGCSVVSISTNDLYEALQRGTIDGMNYNFGSLLPYSLEEVTKYATDGLDLGSLAAIYLMNLEKYNSLSPEIQKIIDEAGQLAVNEQAARYAAEAKAGKEEFTKVGGTIHVLNQEEKAEWAAIAGKAKDDWIKKMEERGFSQARSAYDTMQAIKKQVSEGK